MSTAPIERTKPSALARTSVTTGALGSAASRRVSALRRDPALVRRERRTVLDRGHGARSAFLPVDAEVGERQQMSARIEHQLREVGGALAAQGRDRLADLERVADRLAERLVHVGEHADDFAARMLPQLEHHLRELARVVDGLHERPVADLDVEHDRVGAGCDLLRHDARGDQRHVVDGRGHVAQPVEQLVGRDEVRGLPDDREPDLPHLLEELVLRELDPETGDRLELVERAAGVAETAAAHLPERNAARGDDRADRERRLVPHAARRVLVDDLASERRAEIDRLAAADHRVGQRERLLAVQALEEDRHAEGGHLVVGHVAPAYASTSSDSSFRPSSSPSRLRWISSAAWTTRGRSALDDRLAGNAA